MRSQPINRISEKGLRGGYTGLCKRSLCWRLHGLGVLTYIFDWQWWFYLIGAVFVLLYAYLFIYLFPKIKWLRWRYEVRESEIEQQHGLFIVKRTLIPMVRVQHVDTSQGPILRKYNLAGITISTAATNHDIPVLITEEADELRRRISALARVAEDDV